MTRQKETSAEAVIVKFNNLGECILRSIDFRNFGSVVELKFNNIYNEAGKIRENLSEESLLLLRFTLIQEFHYNVALGKGLLEDLDQINWGHWEVARVCVEDDPSFLSKYSSSPKQFHHMAIYWEDEQRIDIVFHKLEVIEPEKLT